MTMGVDDTPFAFREPSGLDLENNIPSPQIQQLNFNGGLKNKRVDPKKLLQQLNSNNDNINKAKQKKSRSIPKYDDKMDIESDYDAGSVYSPAYKPSRLDLDYTDDEYEYMNQDIDSDELENGSTMKSKKQS